MSSPFVAEIRIWACNFPPTGWAFCDGQLLPISQNTALFSLLGTFYGGDGKSTFALPDMQGNAPMQPGQGNGLSLRDIGEVGGSQYVTLLQSEIPLHSHNLQATDGDATVADPAGAYLAKGNYDGGTQSGVVAFYNTTAPNTLMSPNALSITGSSFPHNNMQPYLTLNFCIALQGVFPARP
jgi:microcystin-dependent protein